MIFDLVHDFAAALASIPEAHPRRRILALLDEAIRRDVHFIDRHPTTLFQCLWNSCWWYDCPEAAAHYPEGHAPGQGRELLLHELLDGWRARGELTDAQRDALDQAVAEVQGSHGVLLRWAVKGPLDPHQAPAQLHGDWELKLGAAPGWRMS